MNQLHQLQQGKALDEDARITAETGGERVWIDDYSWRTDSPPPEGFNGDQQGCYGEPDYSRNCTLEERELLDRRYPDAFTDAADEEREADEAERVAFFAELAEELASPPNEGGD